jgi:thiol-disulfide isomerase/thioredoxin
MKPAVLAALVCTWMWIARAEPAAKTYRVSLEINAASLPSMFVGINIDQVPSGELRATLPGGGQARIERMSGTLAGIIVSIPDADPTSIALLPGQSSVLWLKRTVGARESVPYILGYHPSETKHRIIQRLSWAPAYRAEGRLRLPGCEVGVQVMDITGDGVFDQRDFRKGTTIGLDMNNDGKVWGASEYRMGEEILDICGSRLEVDSVEPTGSAITFRESGLDVPVVGRSVPSFAMTTTNGDVLQSREFGGRVYLLDFWASWCAPCVANWTALEPLAHQHAKELTVIGISVDDAGRRLAAEKLIADKHLSFPQVMRGLGERDPLWKMFGSMAGARLSIPLYVVIDRGRVIRYAGHNLSDATAAIKLLLAP